MLHFFSVHWLIDVYVTVGISDVLDGSNTKK